MCEGQSRRACDRAGVSRHRLEHLQRRLDDQILDARAVGGHVRGGQVRHERRQVAPLLDDDHHVVPQRGLGDQAREHIHRGAVFETAILGLHGWDDLLKFAKKSCSDPGMELYGRQDVNHSGILPEAAL